MQYILFFSVFDMYHTTYRRLQCIGDSIDYISLLQSNDTTREWNLKKNKSKKKKKRKREKTIIGT